MTSLIMINDFIPNFMKKNCNGLPNFKENLCQYLMQVLLDEYQYRQLENEQNTTNSCHLEQHLKNALKKRQPAGKNETELVITIDEIVPFFIQECLQNFLQVDACFVNYYLHLLLCDAQDGLKFNVHSLNGISICKIEQFLSTALGKYKNPLDATICSMKMSYYCKYSQELNLNFVREKNEYNFNNKLKQLIFSILQYPESSTDKQLEEMFIKMQLFIITNYHIGCPDNLVLLKQCRQSLNSILGKGDVQKYVLKKRYHRLEYLQKLGSTAAGIIIFNNQGPQGDKEYVRNIFADLKMAICNTKEYLQEGFDRVLYLKQKACKVMQEVVEVNIQQRNLYSYRPLIQIRQVNKFVALFEVYRKCLEKAKTVFKKTVYLLDVDQKKFDCVVEKINEILKYRSAIESELIFPHFVYLSEIWTSLVLYLNHLVEINKFKDHLDNLLNTQMEDKLNELLEDLNNKCKHLKVPLKYSFRELMNSAESNGIKVNMKSTAKEYCALTMALTGGLLVPTQFEKKLGENMEFCFGFANMEYAKFAELNFKDFIKLFRTTVLTSSDLIVLFQLDEEVMKQDLKIIQQKQAKTKTFQTQTDMMFFNDSLQNNQINTTWNIWDFHRQTIKLANIRKRHTHSTQSKLSFGIRNVQNQIDRKSNAK